MLILNQLNLANGNTRNNNGLDLALATALANAQQQLNPDATPANAKDESALANSLLNNSTDHKMFNLLENSDEINDKMLKLSNYLDALKNGNNKAEGDEEIVVDNESMSDDTIHEDEEMAEEEENAQEENLDDEGNETVKAEDEKNDQETEEEEPTDDVSEEMNPEKRKTNKKAASKETAKQPEDVDASTEAPKENGTKKEDDSAEYEKTENWQTESSTESADEQRFKRRTRSSSLDHQNGTSGKHANERYYETDEEEVTGSRQIDLRKKVRRSRQSNNGTHLGSVVAKLSKKVEQHKSSRSEEKEVS